MEGNGNYVMLEQPARKEAALKILDILELVLKDQGIITDQGIIGLDVNLPEMNMELHVAVNYSFQPLVTTSSPK